jgi:hypothetical protein
MQGDSCQSIGHRIPTEPPLPGYRPPRAICYTCTNEKPSCWSPFDPQKMGFPTSQIIKYCQMYYCNAGLAQSAFPATAFVVILVAIRVSRASCLRLQPVHNVRTARADERIPHP